MAGVDHAIFVFYQAQQDTELDNGSASPGYRSVSKLTETATFRSDGSIQGSPIV